jgi:hypothetical protein
MSHFFTWSEGPDNKVGYDIDKQQYQQDNGITVGDYDEMVNSTLTNGSYIIPNTIGDGAAFYNESKVGGERVYDLQAMRAQSQDDPLIDMIDVTNNGRVHDASTLVDDTLPTDQSLQGIQGGPTTGRIMVHDDVDTSVKGIIDSNPVNRVLFSEMNQKLLQDAIRYGVYKRTERTIGYQSHEELAIVTRSIMLQYANFQTSKEAFVEEIRRLNTKILVYCIENISSNVLQKVQYLKDLEHLPTPIDRPAFVDRPKNFSYDISNLL